MCTHQLGTLPCVNTAAHTGGGKGCVHVAAWAPDRHDDKKGARS